MLIQLFKKSPQDDPDYRLKHHFLLEGNRTDSLTHVMHLFDEKRKYPPAPTLGPLPIKANGAIVVHRPTPNKMARSPEEEDDDSDDSDDDIVMREVTVIKQDAVEDQLVFSMADSKDVIDLMQQENKRLQRQLLIERERNQDGQKSKDKQNKTLREALHTVYLLEKKIARYQHLFPQNDFSEQAKRRQSTGSNLAQLMPTKVSYEHKLHILLNEIDAMQCDENSVRQKMYQYKSEKERLERIVGYKDETIRQLVHEREVLLALHQ
ncbi:hypothetical protein K501DRAFT_282651 [Backusella circina FSU 941]|nr:hypothetical protein K501DRAFT_282651 [Backusella circina FSU 941]